MEILTNSIVIKVIAFLIAVIFHEFMHAWTANFLGDPSAKMAGRISLNPIVHIDIFGTIILPALLIFSGSGFVFGYAKPVPVNPNNFKNPKVGWALVSLAGPLTNFTLAFIFAMIFKLGVGTTILAPLLMNIILINLVLMVFNLIPIPPLDGSRVLFAVLPKNIDIDRLEAYGPILLIALFFFGGGFLSSIIGPAVSGILQMFGLVTLI